MNLAMHTLETDFEWANKNTDISLSPVGFSLSIVCVTDTR
jgi:hypothetical protein